MTILWWILWIMGLSGWLYDRSVILDAGFFHTISPAIHVACTHSSWSNNTISASAPYSSVPLHLWIPSTFAGCREAASRAFAVEQPVADLNCRTHWSIVATLQEEVHALELQQYRYIPILTIINNCSCITIVMYIYIYIYVYIYILEGINLKTYPKSITCCLL